MQSPHQPDTIQLYLLYVELILHIIVIINQVDEWLKESGTRGAITFQNGQSGDNLLLYGPC